MLSGIVRRAALCPSLSNAIAWLGNLTRAVLIALANVVGVIVSEESWLLLLRVMEHLELE